MADDVVIRAEGLGKKYVIGHRGAARALYDAARRRSRATRAAFGARRRDMARGRAIVAGDDDEEFWALKDVSFEVKRGEVLGIIGRNGAGKSTLLKILSRITEPTEGRVTIKRPRRQPARSRHRLPSRADRPREHLSQRRHPRHDARRDQAQVRRDRRLRRGRAFLDTPVKRYSSGMYVRLAFAVAAHLEPEILIVDEVLAVGDAEFQKKCLGKMQDVAGHGRTVLFVSHNMAAVARLCSIGMLLDGGKTTCIGAANSAIAKYGGSAGLSRAITFPSHSVGPSITEISVSQEAIAARHLVVEISFVSPWPLQSPVGGVLKFVLWPESQWGSTVAFIRVSNRSARRAVVCCDVRRGPWQRGIFAVGVARRLASGL